MDNLFGESFATTSGGTLGTIVLNVSRISSSASAASFSSGSTFPAISPKRTEARRSLPSATIERSSGSIIGCSVPSIATTSHSLLLVEKSNRCFAILPA